jgi:uncharacterized membrane protein YdjX (TVP38/TMEM64 family)
MEQLFEIETWINLLNQYKEFGLMIPILLAMVESFIPALPLIGIVAINISAHGVFYGFITSYLGNILGSILVFYFFRSIIKPKFLDRFYHGKRLSRILNWVEKQPPLFLFMISCLAFTPSAFVNMSFGLSGYKKRQFILSIALGKLIMIASLSLFGHSLVKIQDQPLYILLSIIIVLVAYYLSHHMKKSSGIDSIHKD